MRVSPTTDTHSARRSSAGEPKKHTRREYRCACCGYGIVVKTPPTACPMCQARASWTPAAGT